MRDTEERTLKVSDTKSEGPNKGQQASGEAAVKPIKTRFELLQKLRRGRGQCADYKPWFNPLRMSSQGLSHRDAPKIGRLHGYLSDSELDFHFMLDCASSALDIREQFPLSQPSGPDVGQQSSGGQL